MNVSAFTIRWSGRAGQFPGCGLLPWSQNSCRQRNNGVYSVCDSVRCLTYVPEAPVITMKPTALRKNLYKTLRKAAFGERVRIVTKQGTVLLSKEQEEQKRASPGKTKIPGKIVGGLKDADRILRKHLRVPE